MRNILIPCAGLEQNPDAKYIKELIFLDESQWSIREKARVDKACDHGELYHATYQTVDGGYTITSDLGDPDTVISVTFPRYVPLEKAADALARLVEEIL